MIRIFIIKVFFKYYSKR